MRIEMEKVIVASGVGTSVERGAGNVIRDVHYHVWLEDGFVHVVPKIKHPGHVRRMYHSSTCEMYPRDGQSLPVPTEEPKLSAVGGKK